jgi:hypothetical protein
MLAATGIERDSACVACWTGRYPTRISASAETQWAREREPVPSDNPTADESAEEAEATKREAGVR